MITKKLPPYTHQYIQSTDFKGAVESRMTMNYQVTHSQRPLNFEINEVMNMLNINKFVMNAKITKETTSPSYNVYLQHYFCTKLNTTTTRTRGVPWQKKILRVSHRSHRLTFISPGTCLLLSLQLFWCQMKSHHWHHLRGKIFLIYTPAYFSITKKGLTGRICS